MSQIPSLSPRQWEVLRLIMRNRSNKEIAEELGISEHTVKVHVSVVFQKLRVNNRASAKEVGLQIPMASVKDH